MLSPNDIGRIPDAVERARACQRWLNEQDVLAARIQETRDKAIASMRMAGLSQRQCAELVGLSHGRIGQIDTEQGVRTVRVSTMEGVNLGPHRGKAEG